MSRMLPYVEAKAPDSLPLLVPARMPRVTASRILWVGLALAALTLALFFATLMLGSIYIPLDQVLEILAGGDADKASWHNIIFKVRLPRALTAAFAGAALSVGGLMMQTFFRNPLADPFTLGISSGASLGVAFVVLSAGTAGGAGLLFTALGAAGDVGIAVAASVGAALTMGVVLLVARRVSSPTTLLVLGLMFGYFTGAIVSMLIHFSVPERVDAYVNWGFGSFGDVLWNQLAVLIPLISAALIAAWAQAKPLNALLLGEEYAQSMGVRVRAARLSLILTTGVLAGTVTAFCGPIGFLGIAVPHLCRALLKTQNHRVLIPQVAVAGAGLALAAALIAELPGSSLMLPLNAVTALFGAPVVIMVILGRDVGRGF